MTVVLNVKLSMLIGKSLGNSEMGDGFLTSRFHWTRCQILK